MGRIYAKARRDKLNQDLDEILAMLDDMKDENFQISRQKILDRLEEMIEDSCYAIFHWGKQINIDCGGGFDGNLGCLCLETMEEFYV